MTEKKHFDIHVKGRVQNVGFRAFTLKKAREANVTGYVKNMTDGSVYIEAEGSREALDIFFTEVRQGPRWSRVEDFQANEAPLDGYDSFEIR